MSIAVHGVTKLYGQQKALDDVSFEVGTGEIVAFLGPNGAGKTTMMRIITGFIPATSGKVFVNGTEASENNHEVKRSIGYLPENNPLYPDMFVREYLGFVASMYKPGGRVKKQVDTLDDYGYRPEDIAPILREAFGSLEDINVIILDRQIDRRSGIAVVHLEFRVVATHQLGVRGYIIGSMKQPAYVEVRLKKPEKFWQVYSISRIGNV